MTLSCGICAAVAQHRHHIVYRSRGGSDDDDNLIPLCADCHRRVHEVNLPGWVLLLLKGKVWQCGPCKFRKGQVCGLWDFPCDDSYPCEDFVLYEPRISVIAEWVDLRHMFTSYVYGAKSPLPRQLKQAIASYRSPEQCHGGTRRDASTSNTTRSTQRSSSSGTPNSTSTQPSR